MNDAEITADIRIPQVRALEFFVLFVRQVCHGALKLGDDSPNGKIACRQDT